MIVVVCAPSSIPIVVETKNDTSWLNETISFGVFHICCQGCAKLLYCPDTEGDDPVGS